MKKKAIVPPAVANGWKLTDEHGYERQVQTLRTSRRFQGPQETVDDVEGMY